MRPFTATELARMQSTQESAMQDRCELLDYQAVGQDEFGNPRMSYVVMDTVACGFWPNRQVEVMQGTQVSLTDAQLRLSLDDESTVDNLSRVRIVYRFDVELDEPVTYEVIGLESRGPSGLVLNLRLVTDGS